MRTILWLLALALSARSEKTARSTIPIRRFSCGKLYYRTFLLEGNLHSLYVGSMDRIFKLPASDIGSSDCYSGSLQLPPDNREDCLTRNKSRDYDCRNHIKVIQSIGHDRLYICGTNAESPKDWVVQKSLQTLDEKFAGIGNGTGRCPFDPDDASAAIWVEAGNPDDLPGLYAGTAVDLKKKLRGITRMPLFKVPGSDEVYAAMTTMNDSRWLDSPEFVGAFDIGRYVYFFFRDLVLDRSTGKSSFLSFVGRLCKSDTGNRKMLNGTWATYSKARLNCSLPGEETFHFDEIQSVYKIPDDDRMFYASFASTSKSASAVCAFPLQYINDVFNGAFQAGRVWLQEWDPLLSQYGDPEHRAGSCGYDTQTLPEAALSFIRFHSYMDAVVQSLGGRPVYHREGVALVSLAFHREEHGPDQFTILYAGTDDGRVIKVIQGRTSEEPIDGEKDIASGEPISAMVISLEHRSLYVGHDSGVAQIEINVCSLPYRNLTKGEWFECILGEGGLALQTTEKPRSYRKAHLTKISNAWKSGARFLFGSSSVRVPCSYILIFPPIYALFVIENKLIA